MATIFSDYSFIEWAIIFSLDRFNLNVVIPFYIISKHFPSKQK